MQINCFTSLASPRQGARGNMPRIRKKTDQTVKNAITDGFIRQIQTHAQRDAQKGVYMDQSYLRLQHSQMKRWVSPDRSGAMAHVTVQLHQAASQPSYLEALLDHLLGGCSAKIHSAPDGQTAELYSPDGENLASYNSHGGGWTVIQTQAEHQFQSAAAAVYLRAFRAARAEMKTAAAAASASSINIQA